MPEVSFKHFVAMPSSGHAVALKLPAFHALVREIFCQISTTYL
jgi:hypothetical protein